MKTYSLPSLLACLGVGMSIGLALTLPNANAQSAPTETITATSTALKASAIPVDQWARRPEFNNMSLSPNGDWLAAISPFKGRNNLVVINLAERSRRILTSFETTDVANFYWVNNKRICMRVSDGQDVTGNFNYRGTFCINTDGTEFADFTRIDRRSSADQGRAILFNPVRAVGGDSNEYIVSMRARTTASVDLYRFNTINGRYQLLTFNSPGDVQSWVLDRNQVPRAALTFEPRQGNETFRRVGVWYRESADAKWEKLFENRITWGVPYGDSMQILGFDYDNKTLFVSARIGRDKFAVYKYDPSTKKLGDLVFEHPLIDIEDGLLFSNEKKKLVGIRYSAEMPVTKWFDPELEKLQQQLDATLKGMVNNIGIVEEKTKRILVTSVSPTHAGQYYLFDNETKSLEPLVKRRDWLPEQAMSERRFIKYKARDGLEIPAWVTIPKGSTGKNLPLVVHIHGGPQVRQYFGVQWNNERWPVAQFLASRGYAVLEPEPRGSTGFGDKHYSAGIKQWGLAMQDDLTDGALHLVKEGIVDKSRMCLYGGSYGGYASLQGVVREGDLFKCTIPIVAVTDLFMLQQVQHSDIAERGDKSLDTEFTVAVGDSVRDKEQFTRTSPARNVDKINVPVLMFHGSDDRRVPIIHANEFVRAMRSSGRGGLIDYVVYNGEGHGFNKDENVIDHIRRTEQFLAKHIGDETQKKLAAVSASTVVASTK
ncbi:MAG: prolyl oligopeptidase family serine peptidase [Nitrosomonadaceae bacterium]|jgi:dipeptidyl aminopeptidase/acylaminoacyl peptidase|nr:prolyl oligopeptidase family serine peptidase [Nitrosomonadaceae bacterium]